MRVFEFERIKKRDKKNSKEILFEQDKKRFHWQIFFNVLLIAILITINVIESPVLILIISIVTVLLVLLNLVFNLLQNKLVNSAWYDLLKNNEALNEIEKLPDDYDSWEKRLV